MEYKSFLVKVQNSCHPWGWFNGSGWYWEVSKDGQVHADNSKEYGERTKTMATARAKEAIDWLSDD